MDLIARYLWHIWHGWVNFILYTGTGQCSWCMHFLLSMTSQYRNTVLGVKHCISPFHSLSVLSFCSNNYSDHISMFITVFSQLVGWALIPCKGYIRSEMWKIFVVLQVFMSINGMNIHTPWRLYSVRDLAGTYFIVINICCVMISAWGPSHIHDVPLHQTNVHFCRDLIVYLKTKCILQKNCCSESLCCLDTSPNFTLLCEIWSSSINDLMKRQSALRFTKCWAIRQAKLMH